MPGSRLTVDGMDDRADVREPLVSRRARVSPEQVGLPTGGNRRVEGLRRSEVAVLAGVSVEYYTRLERGAVSGASGRRVTTGASPVSPAWRAR